MGTALGRLLAKAGYTITGVSTRSLKTAEKAATKVGALGFSDRPWEISQDVQVVFITTPDDAIRATCNTIADHKGFKKGAVVMHCSGALSSQILSAAKVCQCTVASMHPLQSFASVEQAERNLPGSYCAVEGDDCALAIARQLVKAVGGILLEIGPGGKVLYHAAAVVASNYLVSLLDVALALNRAAGMTPDISFKALLPLIQGTLTNIDAKGIPEALTGPIARGDTQTVKAHLKAMGKCSSQLVTMYKVLGRHTVNIAKSKGTLGDEAAQELASLLGV